MRNVIKFFIHGKKMYKCVECEYGTPMKLGKCPNCSSFGSFIEEKKIEISQNKKNISGNVLSSEDKTTGGFRNISHSELQRIFPEGVKKGGIYLISGDPGIGKSTFVLHINHEILKKNTPRSAYFSGEEQINQIGERINRVIKQQTGDVFFAEYLEDILETVDEKKYDMIIIDSIQTIKSKNIDGVSGSIQQVRFCAEVLTKFFKKIGATCFLIGHVTKGGEIAGPKYLEHLVDVVTYIEGDRYGDIRTIKHFKNRFGGTDNTALFEMTSEGFTPVYDLSKHLLVSYNPSLPGNALTIAMDHGRPLIVHLETLLHKTHGKFPQRNSIGIDSQRLTVIIALLEKFFSANLVFSDIFVNIPGEFKFFDNGLDLAIASSLLSQYNNKPLRDKMIVLGEVGLGGQILPSKNHKKRLSELPKGYEIVDYTIVKNIKDLKNFIF